MVENSNIENNKIENNKIEKRISGFAVASFVLGIFSLIFGFSVFFGIFLGILSIIFGIVALACKSKPAFAVIGIVLSTLGIIIASTVIIIFASVMKNYGGDLKNAFEKIETTVTSTVVKDEIIDNSWETSDDSLLVFENNGKYKYYKDKDDLTDNYYEGTYKIFTGDEAVTYIARNLKKYGVTESEEKQIIETRRKLNSSDVYVCIELTNKTCIVNGENTLEKSVVAPYYGFYCPNNKVLDIANMNTGTNYYFMQHK